MAKEFPYLNVEHPSLDVIGNLVTKNGYVRRSHGSLPCVPAHYLALASLTSSSASLISLSFFALVNLVLAASRANLEPDAEGSE